MFSRIQFYISAALLAALLMVCHESVGAASNPAWQLMDYQEQACVRLGNRNVPSPTAYYGIWIKGAWKSPIEAGANPLPPHASYSTTYTPIPRGTSDGVGSLAYVVVQVSPDTPVGVYTLGVWASDGTMRQSVPVTLRVQTSRCQPNTYGLNP